MSLKITKLTAAIAAIVVSAAMFSACGNKNAANDGSNTETSAAASAASSDSSDTTSVSEQEAVVTTAPLKEGDVYAINKFNVTLPTGLELKYSSEQNQGLAYVNTDKKYEIVVRAINYKEIEKELPVFADSACATYKINNMLYHMDTDYDAPVDTKVGGFDAILYNFKETQNEFDEQGNKNPIAYYTCQAYYFYSDKDVYWIIIDSPTDSWDNCKADVDAFISSISINENASSGSVKEIANGSEVSLETETSPIETEAAETTASETTAADETTETSLS